MYAVGGIHFITERGGIICPRYTMFSTHQSKAMYYIMYYSTTTVFNIWHIKWAHLLKTVIYFGYWG